MCLYLLYCISNAELTQHRGSKAGGSTCVRKTQGPGRDRYLILTDDQRVRESKRVGVLVAPRAPALASTALGDEKGNHLTPVTSNQPGNEDLDETLSLPQTCLTAVSKAYVLLLTHTWDMIVAYKQTITDSPTSI